MQTIDRTGYELLADPLLNKGTAFTDAERDAFALNGLLPPHVVSLDDQVERRLAAFHSLGDGLARYTFLRDLQDTNETLFYALLTRNIEEMLPVVYTPTVGAPAVSISVTSITSRAACFSARRITTSSTRSWHRSGSTLSR